MKKTYFEPSIAINKFMSEDIITTSGENTLKAEMEGKGYTVFETSADAVKSVLTF